MSGMNLQGRSLGGYHAALPKAFNGYLHPHMVGNPIMEIQEKEFFEKLRIGVADGASENGVRKKGGMMEHADGRENVLSFLQQKKDEYLKESTQSILGYWCCSHRLDVVVRASEN